MFTSKVFKDLMDLNHIVVESFGQKDAAQAGKAESLIWGASSGRREVGCETLDTDEGARTTLSRRFHG